ncbi:MAG: glycosidase [Caulobacteraceae bacterium]|nr:glycosidase [Caulobacter sp.]
MVAYVVEALDAVTLSGAAAEGCNLMSPFCWMEQGVVHMMVRVVPKSGHPTGVIWAATSEDGLAFTLCPQPAITPGPGPDDAKGCEDPTVVLHDDAYVVFYTGVESDGQGQLLVAEGPKLQHLQKSEALLTPPKGEGNIKEATLAKVSEDEWVLWYEYAQDNASRIGCARGPSPRGPWTVEDDPFTVRPDSWDRWHLSTGPIEILPGGEPVMFYNGATEDARWRIGWVTFSPDYRTVTGRGVEPLVMPAPPTDRDKTDIAFAASDVVVDGLIHLYYSIEDEILMRATVRRYA